MSDASISQLQAELTAAQNKHVELKQEFFGIQRAMREKKAALDRLKNTHDTSSNTNKYSKSLELEGAIAELHQKDSSVREAMQETENSIILLRYRIDSKKH
ncbi:hypothetical protein LEL_06549 [Akanthomyces lecanii RCEF 1005]|uniref:Uncharacterized protein n=1 Tax=Akanthomyces lecanii RCEF 1005 TaxID=1081108 RepID=A0A162IT51_CORDF|nr:hypothetical protein LEL_06549 [Akanthomyces lecanii RCEF 1005]